MKTRSTLTAFACLLASYLTLSCHKNQETHTPTLTLTNTTMLIDSTVGATDTFTLIANIPWKLTLSPASASSWLQLSPTTGTSSTTVRVSITGKNTNTSQPVTITL